MGAEMNHPRALLFEPRRIEQTVVLARLHQVDLILDGTLAPQEVDGGEEARRPGADDDDAAPRLLGLRVKRPMATR